MLNELNITEARVQLDAGKITALELTKACLKAISENNSRLNAVLTVSENEAIIEAELADERLAAGERGPLLGIPYLAKDILMTKGVRTTASSKILENYFAPYDATVIRKLKEAGAILLGKTNLDEFAHGASTENSAFGPTKNPYDITRVPGGSSGGSAAAVAANLCIFALGTDTGGSIRQPAAFCGIYGLKPSYGRVSRFGLLSMTSSTDVIGPMTKTAEDAKTVFSVIAGHDNRDATSFPDEIVISAQKDIDKIKSSLQGIKIGLPKEYFKELKNEKLKESLANIVTALREAGAEIKEVSLPNTRYGIPVYYIITPSEISSNLARFDGVGWGEGVDYAEDLQSFYKLTRGQGFGSETKRRIMLGTYALSAGYFDSYYKKAQGVRSLIIKDFNQAFQEVDFLLTPTSPHPAFKIGAQDNDPLAMYLEDIFLVGASLAGLPALAFPAGWSEEAGCKLPLSAQLIGPRFSEEKLTSIVSLLSSFN